MPRKLSPTFLAALQTGFLLPLLERVKRDTTLCLAIREGYINIYYRGGSILRLTEQASAFNAFFDRKYLSNPSLLQPGFPSDWTKPLDVQSYLAALPILKDQMDLWLGKHPKTEREYQQLVLRDNNWGLGDKSDYFICDLEYAEQGHRFDLIAARWLSADRKYGDRARLALIEVKIGDAALTGSAGLAKHVRDVDAALANPVDVAALKAEMIELFQQQHALGLMCTKHTLTAFTDEQPELILLLINHDPASSILQRELDLLPPMQHVDPKIATASMMGYGLVEEGVVPLIDRQTLGSRLFSGSTSAPKSSSGFKATERAAQITWREDHLPNITGDGQWHGGSYPHILPTAHGEEALWMGVRDTLAQYISKNDVQAHGARDNLLSSWTLGANLYFPFGGDAPSKAVLARFLRHKLGAPIKEVSSVELEFAADSPLDPATLLGEKGGSRGSGQTSPDVAFLFELDDGKQGVALTEVKYTEDHFYACSALRDFPDSETDCDDLQSVLQQPNTRCAQHHHFKRRYFDRLRDSMGAAPASVNSGRCPAADHGYQLFRQQALAEGLAATLQNQTIFSCVAYHAGNTELIQSVAGPRGELTTAWGARFAGRAKFQAFTHQDWVEWVRQDSAAPAWCADWLTYIAQRYRM